MAKKLGIGLVVALWVVGGAEVGSAGPIVVSGDTTPIFSLTDDIPNDAAPGNRRFFQNVLVGDRVVVLDESSNDFDGPELDAFYGSLPGTTIDVLIDEISAADLTDADLLILLDPEDAFTTDEVDAIDSFLTGSGTLFLLAESFGFQTNDFANQLLADLGSVLEIVAPPVDSGNQSADGDEIVAHILTNGVSSFLYGQTLLVEGGDPLFLTNDRVPFVAIEGEVIPEPSTSLLLGLALGALGWIRRANGGGGTALRSRS